MRSGPSLAAALPSVLLAVAGCALVWVGGCGVATGFRLRSPRTLSCEEFYAKPPASEHVRLTGCRTRLFDASYRERFGAIQEVFAPVVPLREQETVDIRLVLATKDPDARALIKDMRELEKQGDKAAGFAFLSKNAARMVVSRDLQGMIRQGVDRNDETLRKLKEIESNLVEDFAILDEGRRPGLVMPLALIAGGLLCWGLAVRLLVRRRRTSTPNATSGLQAPSGAATP